VRRPWVWEVDARELAERLRHAYEHPAEMRARGERASAHARARWTWRQAAATARQRIERLRQMPSGAAGPPRSRSPGSRPARRSGHSR
jgi:hypothetical protein